jgi:hypothetical protein
LSGPTIAFFPEGAYGPTNNCVGIGRVLRERGARVVFVVEESFARTLEAQGFEEALMRLKPKPEVEEEPGQFWKDFIRDTAPQFRRPTIDQLEGLILPIWQELVDGARYVDERLTEIFDELRPDVIVEDNVVGFPAVVASGRPWARIVSCNPLELKDPGLPPVFSGYPSTDTPDGTSSGAATSSCTSRCGRSSARSASSAEGRRSPRASSSTSRPTSASTSIPPRPTTRGRGRSRPFGGGSIRACGGPPSRGSRPRATASSST